MVKCVMARWKPATKRQARILEFSGAGRERELKHYGAGCSQCLGAMSMKKAKPKKSMKDTCQDLLGWMKYNTGINKNAVEFGILNYIAMKLFPKKRRFRVKDLKKLTAKDKKSIDVELERMIKTARGKKLLDEFRRGLKRNMKE